MRFKLKHADKIVGIFMLIAIFFLLAATIFILLNQKIFVKKIYFKSRFDDKIGLKINQDIFFKGFAIGKITNFKLNSIPNNMGLEEFESQIMVKIKNKYKEETKRNETVDFILKKYNIVKGFFILSEISTEERLELLKLFEDIGYSHSVDVDFFIFENYIDMVKENSVLNKSSNPIQGSTIFLIPNSISTNLAKPNSYIPSLDTEEGKYLLSIGEVKEKADAISTILDNINNLLASINSDNNADENSITRILVNTADSIELLKKELQKVDIAMNNFNEMIYNFKLLSRGMTEPEGLVQKMLDPEGDVMFDSIDKSLENLVVIMENFMNFSAFINSQSKQIETLLLQSKDTVKEAKDVIEGLKNNPLLRGGITEKKSQVPVQENIRDKDF